MRRCRVRVRGARLPSLWLISINAVLHLSSYIKKKRPVLLRGGSKGNWIALSLFFVPPELQGRHGRPSWLT